MSILRPQKILFNNLKKIENFVDEIRDNEELDNVYIENCIEEMLKYEAINAACCDGGSSTALSYKGELINTPSAKGEDGMALPNAWVVRSENVV